MRFLTFLRHCDLSDDRVEGEEMRESVDEL